MFLQLKDLASQKLITVPEEGLTFGREGGDAQVQVADMGVSKRHAEVFCEGGAWFLKDLGSSNGTMLANERIADATEILPGDVFQLSKRKFEVLKVVEDDAGGEEEEQDAPQMTEPERKAPAKPTPKAAAKSAPPPAKKPAAAKMAPAGGREPTRAAPEADDGGGGGDEEMGNASVGQVLAGVPKAVGYYLVNVPLMLLNPFGTIRKGIEEQPKDPMGKMELIAWALPGNIFSGAMGFIAGLISQLILGALSIGSLISGLIVGAIVAVVASVITGIIWHPLMTWLVAKLFKGESDARGRTNYFLQTQTAIIIAVLPSGLTIIIAALRARFGIPFIGLVPVLLSAVTGALSLFVFYKWMEHFQTAKWVKIVALVLMALTALGALAGIPGALSGGGGITVAGSGGSGSGSGSSSGDSDLDIPDDLDDSTKQALAMSKKAIDQAREAGTPPEALKASEDALRQAIEQAKKANEQIKAAKGGDKPAGDDKPAKGDDKPAKGDDKPAKGDDKPVVAKGDDKGKKPPPPEDKPEDKTPEKPVAVAEPEPVKTPPPAAVPSGNGYPSWHAKFENIEKRVTEDPTLLRKASILKLYQELQEETSEADAKVRKDYKKVDAKTLMHLRDAELFETSGKTVDALHKELYGR